jgi:hypothetical protein
MTWTQRLKTIFNIDVETFTHCRSTVEVIAYIEDQVVIEKILFHLEKKGNLPSTPDTLLETRALPPVALVY